MKVCLQQPAFPAYRISFFEALASHSEMQFELIHGDADGITNVQSQIVSSKFKPTFRLLPKIFWDSQQITASRDDFDVVVFSANLRFISLIPALLLARWNRKGTVVWGHFKSKRENAVRRFLRNFAAKFADSILCYDHQARQQLVADGFSDSCVFVAPNSVDVEQFRVLRNDLLNCDQVSKYRYEMGLTRGKTLIFTSRLVTRKKIGFILEIVNRCLQRDPDIRLIILGDGPERDNLEDLCKELGIENAVHFLGATFEPQTVALNFSASDAMLYPTNLGLSLMNAAAMGVPTITEANLTQHGPEASWLINGEFAILVPEMTVDAYAKAVHQLLGDAALRKKIANNCDAELNSRYGVKRMVEGFFGAVQYANKCSVK